MPRPVEAPERIAVVGGGMAGLTAAYELSRNPEQRARFAVTLYQPGFRLGGKLASGRNQEHALRNEEHGLHVWFGFYENAFRMMEEVVQRWHAPVDCPMRTIWDAVRPHDTGAFGELDQQRYRVHTLHYPRTLDSPGRGDVLPSVAGALSLLFDLACSVPSQLLGSSPQTRLGKVRHELTLGWPRPGEQVAFGSNQLGAQLQRAARLFRKLLAALPRMPEALVRAAHAALVSLHELSNPRLERWLQQRPALQQLVYHYDLMLALLRGLLNPAHGIYCDWDLDRVNDWDFRAWLEHNGAHPNTTRRWPLVEALYDCSFQYLEGDRSRPSFEAGTAARFYLRATFTYKNAVAYLFNFGAGEAVIAPLYEVLRTQGVEFRFFHQLSELELSRDGRRVQRLCFKRQAQLCGSDYEPLFTAGGLRCWPTRPRYEQLRDGEALRAAGVDFEHRSSPAHESLHTLEAGADFDAVVLALPAGALAAPDSPCNSWFAAHPRCGRAVRMVSLVPSVAAQLWFDRSLSGQDVKQQRLPQQGRSGGQAMVGWATPFSVWADMTPVARQEAWQEPPRACVYLCGAYHSSNLQSPDSEQGARAAIEDQLRKHGAALWPACSAPDGSFDWQSLQDPAGRSGAARLDAQFVRVNAAATDLCDVAAVGSSRFRLEADASGVENLVLAGTWLRTSINSSCVEAAVMSGLAAARALGVEGRSIIGERFFRTAAAATRERDATTAASPIPCRRRALTSVTATIPPRLLELSRAASPVREGDWILRPGEPVPQILLLQTGEVELWRDERLLGIAVAPRLLGVAAHVTACNSRAGVRAGPGACVAPVGDLTQDELVAALAAELGAAEEEWNRAVVASDDFFESPNARLIPGPYHFGPFSAVLLLVETRREALQGLLPGGLELLPGATGRYVIAISDIQNATAPQAGSRSFIYRETTPLIPCRAGGLRVGMYIPELYPDAYMPIVLGREIYGFPKRLGRTRLDAHGVDVIVDQARLLRARWSEPRPLSGAEFAAELASELLPGFGLAASRWTKRIVSTLGALPALARRYARSPVFLRRQLRSPESLAAEHWQLDELVEVPFTFAPVRCIEEFGQHAVSFAPTQHVLTGSVARAFRAEVAFHFGAARRRRTWR